MPQIGALFHVEQEHLKQEGGLFHVEQIVYLFGSAWHRTPDLTHLFQAGSMKRSGYNENLLDYPTFTN
jgi:hypothetical protein